MTKDSSPTTRLTSRNGLLLRARVSLILFKFICLHSLLEELKALCDWLFGYVRCANVHFENIDRL